MPHSEVSDFNAIADGRSKGLAFVPDPEVKATRRRYPTWYKLQVLREADACNEDGQIGALLRREGIYHCTLTHFRRQRAAGMLGNGANETPAAIASGKSSASSGEASNSGSRASKHNVTPSEPHSKGVAVRDSREEQARRTMELERENRDLRRRLYQAEVLLDLQKKVAELLGDSLETEPRMEGVTMEGRGSARPKIGAKEGLNKAGRSGKK